MRGSNQSPNQLLHIPICVPSRFHMSCHASCVLFARRRRQPPELSSTPSSTYSLSTTPYKVDTMLQSVVCCYSSASRRWLQRVIRWMAEVLVPLPTGTTAKWERRDNLSQLPPLDCFKATLLSSRSPPAIALNHHATICQLRVPPSGSESLLGLSGTPHAHVSAI